MVDGATGDHQAGIKGTTSDTAQRVPGPVIEPVPKVVEAIGNQVFCSPKVEPRINCRRKVSMGCPRQVEQGERGTDIRG